jgi:effector-binding domain-containing protein
MLQIILGGMNMDYHCEIKDLPEQPILSTRTHSSMISLPKTLGKAFEKLEARLKELGEEPSGAPFVAYYNMNMLNLDIEIGFPVKRPLEGNEEIKAVSQPAGKYAMTMHKGPYNKVRPAYNALTKKVKDEGYQTTGVAYEYYFNDPGNTKGSDLLTQVVFPLKPKG